MKTMTAVKTKVETRVAEKEFNKATFIALSTVAIGFGIFAFASLAGGIASVGAAGMVKGWLVAVGLV